MSYQPINVDWKLFASKVNRLNRQLKQDNFNLRQSLKEQAKQHRKNDKERRRKVWEREMSMEKKLLAAATAAAQEATLNERARCLWILDQIVEETRRAMAKKVLIESERHAITVKIQLALAIVAQAKRAIVSDLRPPKESDGTEAEHRREP